MNQDNNKHNLKNFFIKLLAITISIIIVINISYNLILADKIEIINKISTLGDKNNIEGLKNKIRLEMKKGLKKDQVLNEEDKILLYKFYNKVKNEFNSIE
jgi:hypothetical protein